MFSIEISPLPDKALLYGYQQNQKKRLIWIVIELKFPERRLFHKGGLTMFSIEVTPLPDKALLSDYQQQGAYTDCYRTEIPGTVTFSQYLQVFYTTPVFKLERFLLQKLIDKPSTDAQVSLLAAGKTDSFAAWSVEDKCKNQVLMCDYQQRTRSWLMIEVIDCEKTSKTYLYFGSAVIAADNKKNGRPLANIGFSALHYFHKMYSVILLLSAKSGLMKLTGRNYGQH